MCKHIAAVLYGVGARLDERPELLFRLRAVDETELLSDLGNALPDMRAKRDTAQTLVGDDLAALFGLDMEESKAPAPHARPMPPRPAPERKRAKAWLRNLAVAAASAVKAKANEVPPAREKKAAPTSRDKAGSEEFNQGQVGPSASEEHHGTHAVSSEKGRYRPTKSAAKPATAKPSAGNPKGTSESYRVRSPPT